MRRRVLLSVSYDTAQSATVPFRALAGVLGWRAQRDQPRAAFLSLPSQLPTRRIDISAAGFADVGVDCALAQDLLEAHHVLRLWPAERQAGDLVVTDEVDVGADRPADFDKLLGVFGLIVYDRQQDIFQRDLAASFFEIIPCGVEN